MKCFRAIPTTTTTTVFLVWLLLHTTCVWATDTNTNTNHQKSPTSTVQNCPLEAPLEQHEQDQQESHDDDAVIVVTYTMTAHDVASLDALRDELMVLVEELQDSEPGTLAPAAYRDDTLVAYHVRHTFRNADALAVHLTQIGSVFAALTQWATPSPFFFYGAVPAELQQAIVATGIAAEFSTGSSGFEQLVPCCALVDDDDDDNDNSQPQFLRSLVSTTRAAAAEDEFAECDPTTHVRQVPPQTERVTLFCKWVPHHNDTVLPPHVQDSYETILTTMEQDEPDALAVQFFTEDDSSSFTVQYEFRNLQAASFHFDHTLTPFVTDLNSHATAEFVRVQAGGSTAEINAFGSQLESIELFSPNVLLVGTFEFGFARPEPCCPNTSMDETPLYGTDQTSAVPSNRNVLPSTTTTSLGLLAGALFLLL